MEKRRYKRVLASDIHCCFYCGEHPEDREHYVPWVIARMPYYVWSCKECNQLLGSGYDENWTERFERLISKYNKKYGELFIRDYEAQMVDTDGNIKMMLKKKIAEREWISGRIHVMEMMCELLYGEKYVTFHLSDNLERINDFFRNVLQGRDVDESYDRSDPTTITVGNESSKDWRNTKSKWK